MGIMSTLGHQKNSGITSGTCLRGVLRYKQTFVKHIAIICKEYVKNIPSTHTHWEFTLSPMRGSSSYTHHEATGWFLVRSGLWVQSICDFTMGIDSRFYPITHWIEVIGCWESAKFQISPLLIMTLVMVYVSFYYWYMYLPVMRIFLSSVKYHLSRHNYHILAFISGNILTSTQSQIATEDSTEVWILSHHSILYWYRQLYGMEHWEDVSCARETCLLIELRSSSVDSLICRNCGLLLREV